MGKPHFFVHSRESISKDYVRLLKYGDSLYRCKQLKRAALGRLCTIMKRQASSLAYLEQVHFFNLSSYYCRCDSIWPVSHLSIPTLAQSFSAGFPTWGSRVLSTRSPVPTWKCSRMPSPPSLCLLDTLTTSTSVGRFFQLFFTVVYIRSLTLRAFSTTLSRSETQLRCRLIDVPPRLTLQSITALAHLRAAILYVMDPRFELWVPLSHSSASSVATLLPSS
jgi:hypothetical protein